jgi:hypothetical protein
MPSFCAQSFSSSCVESQDPQCVDADSSTAPDGFAQNDVEKSASVVSTFALVSQ